MATRSPWHTRRTISNAGYTVQMNFSGNDLFLTFGYLPGREPHRKATGRGFLVSNIIRPLRDSRAAAGVPFRYCYSTKWGPDGTPPEHRLILSAGPETAEQLAALWPYGPVVIHPLREMGNLDGLVKRLYNEAMETARSGENLIIFSQGLRRPG